MFEKEAEEIANKHCHEIMCFVHCSFSSPKHHRCGEWYREYECALNGAEFGYNKANEWHYVKDGDLPKAEFVDEYKKPRLPSAYKRHYCLCLGDDCIMGKYIKGSFSTVEGHYSLDEVVAWKEIVLPIELRK